MMVHQANRPIDWQARQKALNPSCSFIVQAPAGSGKTELLIQRILVLLAHVDCPEDVLAITFTRKAAAEMRTRVLQALQAAQNGIGPEDEHARLTWTLARNALTNDHKRGWHLLDNPNRLQLKTIDSLCASLVRKMPWLARFGAVPETTDQPDQLYRAAAENLIEQVQQPGPGHGSLTRLLRHLDNRVDTLRDMLVDMLGRRDQWLRHLLNREGPEAKVLLESSLKAYVETRLETAYHEFGQTLRDELAVLIDFSFGNLQSNRPKSPDSPEPFQKTFPLPIVTDLDRWGIVCDLLLTQQNSLRKTVTSRQGFPTGDAVAVAMKQRMLDVLTLVSDRPNLLQNVIDIRFLPNTAYPLDQWDILGALVELLPLAVIELQRVFREKSQVDFTEIAGAARAALGDSDSPEELLLRIDNQIKHLLVDEFQDTSRGQYALIEQLTAGWMPGDGRTVFLVGDPMQSIYRFREADVGLYLKTRKHGLPNIPMESLTLQTNFRSQAGIVQWVNETFAWLFPDRPDEIRGAVPYSKTEAHRSAAKGPAVTHTIYMDRQDQQEADDVVLLIKQLQLDKPKGSIAILVRSRNHLNTIVKTLKVSGINYLAQEIDALCDRPVVQDLRALTRAILHRGDRVAWLAILRAPWCGLTLDDLMLLCSDNQTTIWDFIENIHRQDGSFDQMNQDSCLRLARFYEVMGQTLHLKGRLPLHRLVESAWLALGGAASAGPSDLIDAEQFLKLLRSYEKAGDLERLDIFDNRLNKLFACSDTEVGHSVQIMTIHKAKGLEFDTVIIPGLGRPPRPGNRTLLRWQELPNDQLLLAPVPAFNDPGDDCTYAAIGRLIREKEALETLRLFYVGATRARTSLHLFGHIQAKDDGCLNASNGSLLDVSWETLKKQVSEVVRTDVACAVQAESKVQAYSCLPGDWSLQPLAKSVANRTHSAQSATSSMSEMLDRKMSLSLRSEAGKAIGSLTHAWLERLAVDGLEQWSQTKIKGLRPKIRSQLSAYGISMAKVPGCAEKILNALLITFRSQTGRWILSPHVQADSELRLSGIIDGQLIHATLDRTFLTNAGERWIVDFKISDPGKQDRGDFISNELVLYSSQMQIYKTLYRQLEPQNIIRTALYFPLLDVFEEYTD